MKTLSILASLTLLGSALGARSAYDDADGLWARDAGIADAPGLYARQAVNAAAPLPGLGKRGDALDARAADEAAFDPTLQRRYVDATDTAAAGGPSPRLERRTPGFGRLPSKHFDRVDSKGSK